MADDDGPADGDHNAALVDLGRKLDTVAGAVAAIAASHNDLLGHVAEAEARRSRTHMRRPSGSTPSSDRSSPNRRRPSRRRRGLPASWAPCRPM